MLVTFTSTETGEILMFADLARTLLQSIGKECTAKGVITQPEMAPLALRLRHALEANEGSTTEVQEDEEDRSSPPPFNARAWPLIDMLERSQTGGAEAHIQWRASSDF